MYFQDSNPSSHIWPPDHDLSVESSRSQECRVKDIRSVRGRNQDYPFVRFKAIHLHQELVECLLTLIVSAPQTCATQSPHCIDLIDEYDTRCVLLPLLKQVSYPRCPDADEHLYKVRTTDAEERDIRLTGYRLCQEGLAGP